MGGGEGRSDGSWGFLVDVVVRGSGILGGCSYGDGCCCGGGGDAWSGGIARSGCVVVAFVILEVLWCCG